MLLRDTALILRLFHTEINVVFSVGDNMLKTVLTHQALRNLSKVDMDDVIVLHNCEWKAHYRFL